MKILLVCAAGMSTSLVVEKIKKALSPEEQDWVIKAEPVELLPTIIDEWDVILLGPQISYKKAELSKLAEEHNRPLDVIKPMDYGMGKGENILKQVKSLINK
ncbi:PTS sugar transporter subunit IIB [Clostridium intestinale]|uniref:PTS sugar transporter subunit IIB n=1 Tax=Clostridium intestinale TaxID=36845 RepID=UPI0028EF9EC1|nr:PTS sugar transporter subunit IIB [Clostridium intestinale]